MSSGREAEEMNRRPHLSAEDFEDHFARGVARISLGLTLVQRLKARDKDGIRKANRICRFIH